MNKKSSNNWVWKILARYNLSSEFEKQYVLLIWSSVIGANLCHLTRALRFDHGVLWIEVSSPTLGHELSYLKERYIEALNNELGEPFVRDIRFIPGHFSPARLHSFPPPSPEEHAAARAIFSTITDPHLRGRFERLYLTQRQRDKAILAAGGKRCLRCGVVFLGEGELCPGCRFDQIEEHEETD